MKEIKKCAILLGLLWLVCPLVAQDTRFSGRWVMNREKTQMGAMPDITIEISLAEGVIHYRQTVKDSQNVWVTQMALSADGKEGSYTNYQGIRLKCSAMFRDGKLYLAYQSRQRRSGKWVILDMKDELSVSADGKTLSIVHEERWDDKRAKWPRAMVLDKQAENAEKVQDTKKC